MGQMVSVSKTAAMLDQINYLRPGFVFVSLKLASLAASAAVSVLAVYPGVYYYFSSTSSRLTME